jgi:alkanesulfonate monooxygenase SsuD/methylene tetrahydromethanopterin reductase-like flavin-dependent oxidoreductase (luciferase family)
MGSPDRQPRAMRLGIVVSLDEHGPEGVPLRFRAVRAQALEAERMGLDSFWVPDHFFYRAPGQDGIVGQWEALTTLSALAAVTEHITLGPMVAATSFRSPTLLAKMADTLDEISDGRFVLGLGAGWHQPEYDAFGFLFDHRAGRFAEALQIIAPLLREGRVSFAGQYYQATDCVLRPRGPSARGPRILAAGFKPRMMRLIAQHADAWNTAWHTMPEQVAARWEQMQAACDEVGRDPATLELTAGVMLRIARPGQTAAPSTSHITGEPEQIAEVLRGFQAVGVRHLVMVVEPDGNPDLEGLARVVALLDGQ